MTIQAMEDESAAPVDLIKIDEERPTVSSALESPTDEPAKASDQQKVPEMRIVEEALSDKTPLKELAPEIPEAATIDPMPKPVAVEAQPLDPALSETVKTVEAAPPQTHGTAHPRTSRYVSAPPIRDLPASSHRPNR